MLPTDLEKGNKKQLKVNYVQIKNVDNFEPTTLFDTGADPPPRWVWIERLGRMAIGRGESATRECMDRCGCNRSPREMGSSWAGGREAGRVARAQQLALRECTGTCTPHPA